jgi:hypothetical protein
MNHIVRIAAISAAAAVIAVSPAEAQNMNAVRIVSGDGQAVLRTGERVPGGQAHFAPLVVELVDSSGRPLGGQRVVFSCPQTRMACQLNPAGGNSASLTTGADGRAVLNGMGGNSVSAYYASGAMPITVSADNAAPVTFNLTVLDPPPPPAPVAGARMTLVSGNGQVVPRTIRASGAPAASFAPLTVSVTDANGRPLPDVQVAWTCAKPENVACQSEPSGASPTLTRTDANGNATLNKMGGSSVVVYYGDTAFRMTASYGTASTTFDLTAGGATPISAIVRIVSGDGQSVARTGERVPGGQAHFAPLVVELVDSTGRPLGGQRVVFSCPQTRMACQLNPAGGNSALLTTGADGRAVLNGMGGNSVSAYYASGAMPITVSADNAAPVTFNLTVLDPPPPPAPVAGARMTLVSGNGQVVPRTIRASGAPAANFAPLTVSVTDANGRPLPDVQVAWTCAKPENVACQSEPSGASPTITRTDANGNATLNKMGGSSVVVYYGDTAFRMTASYGTASTTFDLTAGARAPLVAGARMRNPTNGATYLVLDGKLRHIPDPQTFDNLYASWSGVTPMAEPDPATVGAPLTGGAYLAAGTPDGRVFLITDGTRRWISSAEAFNRYSFDWGRIRRMPAAQLEAIREGPQIN